MKLIIRALSFLLLLVSASSIYAFEEVNVGVFSKLAIEGYDTVAYFTEGEPVRGKRQFETEWNGANWRFSSEENMKLFQENPAAYAPQYGGYCAWAVSLGKRAEITPSQFTIHDGKLYLNYNSRTKRNWLKEKQSLIGQGDSSWLEMLSENKASATE